MAGVSVGGRWILSLSQPEVPRERLGRGLVTRGKAQIRQSEAR